VHSQNLCHPSVTIAESASSKAESMTKPTATMPPEITADKSTNVFQGSWYPCCNQVIETIGMQQVQTWAVYFVNESRLFLGLKCAPSPSIPVYRAPSDPCHLSVYHFQAVASGCQHYLSVVHFAPSVLVQTCEVQVPARAIIPTH